ncbi:MAG TPA: helix-turn-helix domain-containing protein [Galbitalea sp.]
MTNEPATSSEHHAPVCDKALVHAFGFLGKRWNGVILGTLMESAASFSELRRAVEGISDSVLSERLTELGAAGLVSRTVDAGPPLAVVYALTASGAALLPALTELTSWARSHLTLA